MNAKRRAPVLLIGVDTADITLIGKASILDPAPAVLSLLNEARAVSNAGRADSGNRTEAHRVTRTLSAPPS